MRRYEGSRNAAQGRKRSSGAQRDITNDFFNHFDRECSKGCLRGYYLTIGAALLYYFGIYLA